MYWMHIYALYVKKKKKIFLTVEPVFATVHIPFIENTMVWNACSHRGTIDILGWIVLC